MKKVNYLLIIVFAYYLFSCKTIDKPSMSNVRFDTPPTTPMKVGYTYNLKIIEEGKGDVFALVSNGSSYISRDEYLPIVNGQVKYVHRSGVKYLICKKYNPSIGDFGKSDTLYFNWKMSNFSPLNTVSVISFSENDFFGIQSGGYYSDPKLLKYDFLTLNSDSITKFDSYSLQSNVNVLSNDLKYVISFYESHDYRYDYRSNNTNVSIYNTITKKMTNVNLNNHSFMSPDHKYVYSYNVDNYNVDDFLIYDILNNKTISANIIPRKDMVLGNCTSINNPDYVYYEGSYFNIKINGVDKKISIPQTSYFYSPTNLKMTSDSKYVYYIFNGSIYSLATGVATSQAFNTLYTGNPSNMSLNISNTKLLFYDKVWKTLDLKTTISTSLSTTLPSGTYTW